MQILIKRVYEQATDTDGYRVLVDHLWPRGLTKEKAAIDWWDKNIAPSTQLRMWFGHSLDKWEKFSLSYKKELENNPQAIEEFKENVKDKKIITLIYAAKDEQHNNALILQSFLHEII